MFIALLIPYQNIKLVVSIDLENIFSKDANNHWIKSQELRHRKSGADVSLMLSILCILNKIEANVGIWIFWLIHRYNHPSLPIVHL